MTRSGTLVRHSSSRVWSTRSSFCVVLCAVGVDSTQAPRQSTNAGHHPVPFGGRGGTKGTGGAVSSAVNPTRTSFIFTDSSPTQPPTGILFDQSPDRFSPDPSYVPHLAGHTSSCSPCSSTRPSLPTRLVLSSRILRTLPRTTTT